MHPHRKCEEELCLRKMNRKKRILCSDLVNIRQFHSSKSSAVGAGAMFLLVLVFFQLMTAAHTLCVWQRGDGVRVACGFRQSGLLRLRNYGGVKSWAGLGFSVGDEDGFKESLTNVEQAEAESRAYQDKGVFSLRETRDQYSDAKPYSIYLDEDENSDEIPEDTRRRRFGKYDDLSTTSTTPSTTTASSPAEKINNSFEKRSSQELSKTSTSSAKQQHLKKMTVSVNIPEFEPMPFEFELSSVKVGSNETVDKYLNTPKPTTSSSKINLNKFYKKSVKPSAGSLSGKRKKPFRIQLLETTEQIAEGFKYKNRRGTDGQMSHESTLLVPASAAQKQQKLSKALLRQHVKNPRAVDEGSRENADAAIAASNPASVGRQFNSGSSGPASLSLKDVEKHLLNLRDKLPPVAVLQSLTRMNAPPPGGNRRSYPREKRPHQHGPPLPPNFPRNHRKPGPGGPRIPPRKPEPTGFPKQKVQSFHGPPTPDNSVRLPLAVLRKYLPKTFSWPGRNNPHARRPMPPPPGGIHANRKNVNVRRPPLPKPRPSPGDSHTAGSIHHHQMRPKNHHGPLPTKFPTDPSKKVVLPVPIKVPVSSKRPVGPPRPGLPIKHHKPRPSPFAPSPAIFDDDQINTAGWRPGHPEAYFRHQASSMSHTPTAITISSPPPSVVGQEHPANEKESILQALKTLSQAKAEVIKSIVKEGSLPQGVINIASSTNETSTTEPQTSSGRNHSSTSAERPYTYPPSKHMPHPPTTTALPAILPMIMPSPTHEEQEQESIHHFQHQLPPQFDTANPNPFSHSNEYYGHESHDPFEGPELIPENEDADAEQEQDETELYTEKINSISAKLSELPDNEEFITLPIDDVLSMLLATTKQAGSEEKSRDYVSTYFGVNKDLQQEHGDEDDEERLSNRQTELGRTLYDMGIIHRIAAGNLTVAQMAIVNKLIDLNQNERMLTDDEYDHEAYGSEKKNVYVKKPPAKYILPTTVSAYSNSPATPPRYTTTTTTEAPTTTTRRPTSPPHDYSYHRGIIKQFTSHTTFRPQTLTNLKTGYGSIIDEKVKAALHEYNTKQAEKNRNQDMFSKRHGQASSDRDHDHDHGHRRRVSSSKSDRDRDDRSSSRSKYSERRSPLYEREREESKSSSRPSSSRKRVLGRTERKQPEEHVVIIRPSPARRRHHSHSSSSSRRESKSKQKHDQSSPVMVDLGSIL